jgi:hypothetical protein
MSIELINISPSDNWPDQKKRLWANLQVLTQRIIEKGEDITSNFGSDYYHVRYTYALFAQAAEANQLFHKVCALSKEYSYDSCHEDFTATINKTKYKTLKHICNICQHYGIDTQFEDEPTPSAEKAAEYLPEDVDPNLYDTYGFFEKNNQYFTLESSGKVFVPKPFTNFTMKVLFHMHNGQQPRRVIEVTNIRNNKKVVDIPTDRLVSKNEFKKFLEGLGNYRFFGTDGKLDMLKAYLYDQEAECTEIAVLGWHESGFWAWSNGIFNAKFHALDDHGFVELHDSHYYIPSGNTNQQNRNRRFSNELRFKHHQDHTVTFEDLSRRYCEVFKLNGPAILLFSVACLFSDIVFHYKQFFPLLFVYGEGGSGKGSAIKAAQRLFGKPQDPLTLSGKANTDKAKIAMFAQFINSMLLLEEYVNNHDIDQLLKNLWDRYGYKRRTMDMGYGTETVPIQSGVAITGNFSPTDDPLLQRLIYLEHNENKHGEEEKLLFNSLMQYLDKGVTSATHQLLKLRPMVEAQYLQTHADNSKKLTRELGSLSITSRMIENITVLISMYDILSGAGIQFPFTRAHIINELVTATKNQNIKRDSGGEVSKFFDVFYHLISTGIIKEDIHFRLEGNSLMFNLKTIHPYYMEWHRKLTGQAGLSWANLKDKIKVHPAYGHYSETTRIGETRTSAFVFRMDQTGIDIIAAISMSKANSREANKGALQKSYDEKVQESKTQWKPVQEEEQGELFED